MAQWDKISDYGNVEDRRGLGGAVVAGGGSIVGAFIVGLMVITGTISPDTAGGIMQELSARGAATNQSTSNTPNDESYKKFASQVLGSLNAMWTGELASTGKRYVAPKMVLFRNQTNSACSGAKSSTGPHYCSADKTIYLDETFFDSFSKKLGAKGGDAAEAYVMAHEVGHHIQLLLGTTQKYDSTDNATSIAIELQADCYAGYWMGTIAKEGIIDLDDAYTALDAASAVGDDNIQLRGSGRINKETWDHGSSAQRKNSFKTGYSGGKVNVGYSVCSF